MSTASSFASVTCALAVILMGWTEIAASDQAETSGISSQRQPRHLTSKLCLTLGLCGGQGHGGYQGGYKGGFGGFQGGYPPINIGISQSQSSSSAGGGGYGSGYFPNNYQYNGYPGGHYNGYPGGHYNGYPGGYNRPGYFGNGSGSYNNQFNGNYYGGRPQGGGYGFQGPFGNFYDEGSSNIKPVYENEYSRSTKSKN